MDTPRTRSALLDLYPDNSSGLISEQDIRDFVVTALPPNVVNVEAYGTLQDAIDAWVVEGDGAILYFPPDVYVTTAPLVAEFTRSTGRHSILGRGAQIAPSHSEGPALEIRRSGTGVYVSHLLVEGLNFNANYKTTDSMLYLNGGDVNDGAIFRVVLRDLSAQNFMGDGYRIEGSAFELMLDNCGTQALTNTEGHGVHILAEGTGKPSSIDIYGGTYDGCQNNVHVDASVGGVKVFGGTYLRAQREAIYIGSGLEAALYSPHIEQAWRSGAESPDWTTGQAGVFVSGRARLDHVYGTANDRMRYVARTYTGAGSKSVVIGGVGTGSVESYLRATGASTSTTVAIGVDSIDNGITSGGELVEIG